MRALGCLFTSFFFSQRQKNRLNRLRTSLADKTMSALVILAAKRDIMLQINNDDVFSRLVRH